MEYQKQLILLLVLFLFLLDSKLILSEGQLLPIVDEEEGNATHIQTYIIHVVEPEGAQHLGAGDLERWYRSFLPNTTLDTGEPRLVYSYRDAISGFAARLTGEELRSVEAMDGFLMALPDKEIFGQTTYTPSYLGLNQNNGLWYDSNQGEGMIIGVIDSGIIPTHPSFQDAGLPPPPRKWHGRCDFDQTVCNNSNNKLIGAVTFVGNTPLDGNGHGTHTAGTAAGNFVYDAEVLGQARGVASGTAPRAHVAVYRVLDSQNRGSTSDFLAGIDRAVHDGVDVLSMSLGAGAEPLPRSQIAIASFSAIKKGIFPSVCAMNNGPTQSDISNDYPWGLTVGASTHDRRIVATVRLGDGKEFLGESAYQFEDLNGKFLPVVYPGAVDNTQTRIACLKGGMNGLDVRGKIVLCGTGVIENTDKGQYVKNAGAAAMIVMNLPSQGFTTFAHPHVLPASHVSYRDARKILNYLQTSANPTATIIFGGTKFGNGPSPAVAFFSGRGPSRFNGGIIKPDILGPGVNILAAWPFEVGPKPVGKTATFNFDSGTSMATPHISGIAAMLKKSHPTWSPAAIKSAMMTTAYVADSKGNPITDEAFDYQPASVFAMGAGHVNPAAADDPGLVYDLEPNDYIPYLCGLYSTAEVWAITRTYVQCSSTGSISPEQLNYPSIGVPFYSATSLTKTVTRTVTNVGEANEAYSVNVNEPRGVKVEVFPNVLQFSALGQKLSYNVRITIVGKVGRINEGRLSWVSNKHVVRSPLAVTI